MRHLNAQLLLNLRLASKTSLNTKNAVFNKHIRLYIAYIGWLGKSLYRWSCTSHNYITFQANKSYIAANLWLASKTSLNTKNSVFNKHICLYTAYIGWSCTFHNYYTMAPEYNSSIRALFRLLFSTSIWQVNKTV